MTNHSQDFTDLIAHAVRAFERMRVPPGPSVQETIDFVERVASRRGEITTALDHDAVAKPVSARNEDDSDSDSRSSRRAGALKDFADKLGTLTNPQRTAVAGALLSTVVGITLLLLALNSGQRLSAMERMARQLREVKSYSYKESWRTTWVGEGGKQTTTWRGDGQTFWHAPNAFRSGQKIVKIEGTSAQHTEQVLEDFIEVYPAGKLGIFIDHTMKTYRRLPFVPTGSFTYPSDLLRMIRENSGEVTRDLGTKEIQGKKARGYMIALKDAHEDRVPDPVEVWVDPETDLPLQFGYEGKNETTYERRIAGCRWNIELAPELFEAKPPAGYADITPPSSQQELAQIAAALKLYAELSGGHYPPVTGCDGIAVRDEMLKLAGYSGEPRDDWKREVKFQRIERATAGLDWIARIVRNRNHSGYYPQTVGPQDKDKVLLWWREFAPVRYRAMYGDLRTEIVSESRWAEPAPERETSGRPADAQRPKDKR